MNYQCTGPAAGYSVSDTVVKGGFALIETERIEAAYRVAAQWRNVGGFSHFKEDL